MTECVFSSPAAASPECSAEVEPHVLVPSQTPLQALPATGSGLVSWLIVVGLGCALAGMCGMVLSRSWDRLRPRSESESNDEA